jgi:hypothetical protein
MVCLESNEFPTAHGLAIATSVYSNGDFLLRFPKATMADAYEYRGGIALRISSEAAIVLERLLAGGREVLHERSHSTPITTAIEEPTP